MGLRTGRRRAGRTRRPLVFYRTVQIVDRTRKQRAIRPAGKPCRL